MSSEGSTITNANNVACHVVGSWMSFFVNLSRSVDGVTVAAVDKGKVVVKNGEEEWPFVIHFQMMTTGGHLNLARTINTLANFSGSHYLVKGATSAEESPIWTLDNGELFCVKVNVGAFSDTVCAAPCGEPVRLVNVKTNIRSLYRIDFSITCPGKAEFPRSYKQSTSNPRFSDSPSRPDGRGVTSEGSPENPARRPTVARQLNLGSTTPEDLRRRGEADVVDTIGGGVAATITAHSTATGTGALERIDDALYLDSSTRQRIRLLFYPDRCRGNLFKRDLTVQGGIGVQLLIQICEPNDPRVAPAKSERRRNSSSSFALSVPKRREGRVETVTNVDLELVEATAQQDRCLIIAFNGEETHGYVDVGALLKLDGYMTDEHGSDAANRDRAYVVASCKNHIKASYIIDFLATLGQTQMPSEREVYIAVSNFFYSQGLLGGYDGGEEDRDGTTNDNGYDSGVQRGPSQQSLLEALQLVDMEEIREHVFTLHDYFVERASLPERQSFSLLVWACTRDCIINKVLSREEPLLDQSNIVSEMLLN